jgi:hypothetical protein
MAAAGIASCGGAAPPPPPTPTPIRAVAMDEIRNDMAVFASDSFGGRESGTPYIRKAASFLANRLVSLGLEPAGDSLYYQRVPLYRTAFQPTTRFTVTSGQMTQPLQLGPDLLPVMNLGPGAPLPRRNAEGDVYFAGYGMDTLGRRDFSKLDAPGRVIVMIHGAPPSVTDSALRTKLEGNDELSQRIVRALPYQPTAIILLLAGERVEFYNQALPSLLRGVSRSADASTSDAQRPLPMVLFGVAKQGSALLPPGWPGVEEPQLLTGRRFSARIDARVESYMDYNIVAVVRGTDPRLNKSYVAFGAHYDHVGFQPGAPGADTIANGADDDASGSITMLAIAKSMLTARPRRSVLFVWHTAEEKGLLGSEHFTANPTVPIDSIVAMINLDMIGRRGGADAKFNSQLQGASAENKLFVLGPLSAPNNQSRTLGAIFDSVNARQVRPFTIDRAFDNPNHPEHYYDRSDHINYARKGIPIIFFSTGFHEDYHKVSDEVSKIDFTKMSRIGGLLVELGTTIGNREAKPR